MERFQIPVLKFRGKSSLSNKWKIGRIFIQVTAWVSDNPKVQPVTALRQWLHSWGSLLHKAKRARQGWQGTRKKHEMRRRNNKHCKKFERTKEGSFSRWKSTGQIWVGNSCFCKKNLNKIYICFCLILRLAAPPKVSWASTSDCLSIQLHYGAHRLYPQLLHEFHSQNLCLGWM